MTEKDREIIYRGDLGQLAEYILTRIDKIDEGQKNLLLENNNLKNKIDELTNKFDMFDKRETGEPVAEKKKDEDTEEKKEAKAAVRKLLAWDKIWDIVFKCAFGSLVLERLVAYIQKIGGK